MCKTRALTFLVLSEDFLALRFSFEGEGGDRGAGGGGGGDRFFLVENSTRGGGLQDGRGRGPGGVCGELGNFWGGGGF